MGVLWCQYPYIVLSMLLIVAAISSSSSNLQPTCPDDERLALLNFKQYFLIDCAACAFRPTTYPKVRTWKSEESENCCLWDGVECDEYTGHVTDIDLSNSCLYGTFPQNSSIFRLKHLKTLNLACNDFNYSHIPHGLGHFSNLRSLNLSNSAFSGQIPSEISKLSKLSVLELSWNGGPFSQLDLKLNNPSLETLLLNLTSLNKLYLSRVDISSTVPMIMKNLTSLKAISLQLSNIYGELPPSIFHLPHLEILRLDSNRALTGFLPPFHHKIPLKILDLSFTSFSGQVPPSIGRLSSLEVLDLSYSYFSGTISSSLTNLTRLTHLGLGSGNNNFRGDFLISISNLTQLQALDISNLNLIPETFTSQLAKLHELHNLRLAGLNLAGEIPFPLSNLTKLKFLDLRGNQLIGSIPLWFRNLTQLTALILKYNQLQGPIPQWLSKLTYLEELSLSYNSMFGNFESFHNFSKLLFIGLSGINLTFPSNKGTSTHSKFQGLQLDFCNLTKFPQILKGQDKLKTLSMRNNNIKGKIPQWFVNTTRESLLFIDLSNNNINGFEQPSVVLPWSKLEVLDFSNNEFREALPHPITSIMIYRFSNNILTGGIPNRICKVNSLQFLDLSNNSMTGPIPNCIADQLGNHLSVLNLRDNRFHGHIPHAFTESCRLKMINLSKNQLEGKLPKSLVNCTMLEVLDIGRNHVRDEFPAWLGSLQELQVLVLSQNNFYGRIKDPESHLDFSRLHIIDLSYNHITGNLPSGYCQNWKAMQVQNENQTDIYSAMMFLQLQINTISYEGTLEGYNYSMTTTEKGNARFYSTILNDFRVIDLSSNHFTGKIPDILGNLKGLQVLNLSNNHLDEAIPSSLSNIRDLESLDLSNNRLSGVIPHNFSQLTSLEVFNVCFNHLVGPVPQGNQFNTFDDSSFCGNLGLCGDTLSKKCENVEAKPPLQQATRAEKEDRSEFTDWTIRLLGYLSGTVTGFVVGKYYITDRYHRWFTETFQRWRRPRTITRVKPSPKAEIEFSE